jgi:DNA primase
MREIIEKVKDSTTIETVVGETVSLKRSGSNLKGCCPLHNEKTPSFFVRPSAQTFHCYGCGKSGDVIQFIIERDGLSFMDALRLLASKANIDLPQNAFSEDDSIQSNPTTNLKAFAKAFQVRLLINQAQAVSYWQTRGLLEETIIDFGCSYADGSEIDLLIEREKKQAIGIIHSDGKPVFKHRFTIPIFDSMGNVIAWGARAVGTANPKYLNSSTTDIYEKSKILFNLNFARRYIRAKDEVIIVTEAAFFIPIYLILYHFVLPNRIPQKKEKIQKRITFAKISSDYDHSKIKTKEFAKGFRLLQELLVFVSEALCEFRVLEG